MLFAAVSRGQVTSFGMSAGYSHLESNASGRLFHATDGGYFDADFAWRLPGLDVPLYAGVGASGTGYYEDRHVLLPYSGYYDRERLYSDVGLFAVEGRIAMPIGFQQGRGWFVMPRLGMGLVVNSYSIDTTTAVGSTLYLDTRYHDGAAFGIRPSIQAGYSWGNLAAGTEVSYMVAWGDFGELGSTAQELRGGVPAVAVVGVPPDPPAATTTRGSRFR